jgi:Matrixin
MPAHRPTLGFEALGDRCLPTMFGIPWADPNHLTLSFVPDGTATPYGPSSVFTTLGGSVPTASWQRDVLRAFQTWAVNANIDVGLVADGGQPLGAVGAVQWDSRFGDVRVAAAPLSSSLVASGSPFSWSGTTLSGDVVFNSDAAFGIGLDASRYDVFSLTLHEAGHVFGLDHSTAAGSAMDETYRYLNKLSASDVAALRGMYGVRVADSFDTAVTGGNDTLARASVLPRDSGLVTRLMATGDLTTLADVDFYKFTVPLLGGITGVSVRLQAAGLSLLAPAVKVYNSAGQVVASATSADPLANNLSLRFTPSPLGGTYFVKVDGATTDVFGIGGYRLAVDLLTPTSLLSPLAPLLSPILDGHTDDTLGLARVLSPIPKEEPDSRFDFTFKGVIEDGTDVDRFKIHAPATPGARSLNMNVIVWALETNGLNPRIQVYDATLGRPVAFQVLANDTGVMTIQVPNVNVQSDYIVSVLARTAGGANDTGSYFLAADFNRFALTKFDGVASDTVGASATRSASLTLNEAATFELALSAEAFVGGAAGVTMTLYNAAGQCILTLKADSGKPMVTAVRYLSEGTYTVQYTYRSTGGTSPAPAVEYSLFLLQLSDGAGPYATDTSSSGDSSSPPPSSSGGYTYSGSSTARPSGSPYYF